MNEFAPLGCGRFSESAWADLASDAPSDSGAALREHIVGCRRCRDEWGEFAALAEQIRATVQAADPDRQSFVDSVLAATEGARQAARADGRKSAWPRFARPAWAAAMLALLAVLGAGVVSVPGWWPLPPPAVPETVSVGEVLPGGAVVPAPAAVGAASVRAGALRPHGAASAASAAASGAEVGGAEGASIRVTSGASASGGDATAADGDEAGLGPEGSRTFP